MNEQSVKALRSAKRKGYYKAQFDRTAKNEKRRMIFHLRRHPADRATAQVYEKRFGGRAHDLGLTKRGLKRAALLVQHQE